jgi:hypothetical protein
LRRIFDQRESVTVRAFIIELFSHHSLAALGAASCAVLT